VPDDESIHALLAKVLSNRDVLNEALNRAELRRDRRSVQRLQRALADNERLIKSLTSLITLH
jgi:hypothetical protein